MGSATIILPFVGIFLAAIAAAVGSAFKDIPWLSLTLYGLASAMFALWVALDWQNFKRFFSRKGSKYGASSGLSLVLGILVLVGIGFLASKPRFNKSFDVTRTGMNTLSEQSLKVISTIKEKSAEVEVLGFFQDDMQKTKFRDLLQLYESRDLPIKATYVDPQTAPTTTIANNVTQPNTVIVKRGTQEARINTLTEEKLTNALVKVMKDKTKKVYFTKGHGEGELEGTDAEGYKSVVDEMKSNKIDVESLSILEKAEIPADADLVVIAGPKYDFKEEELKILAQYVGQAKPLLVMVDAMVPVPALNGFLKDYGLTLNDDLLILRPDDPRAALLGQNNAIVSVFDDFSPITKDYARKSAVALLMPSTRSLSEITANPHSMKVSLVAKTSEIIIGVRDVKTAADLKNINESRIKTGEFGVVGVATGLKGGSEIAKNEGETPKDTTSDAQNGEKPNQELRIVVAGSSQLATNAGAQRPENLNMFTNMTNFLLQDEDFIAIKPKDLDKSTIDLTSGTSQLTLAFLTYIYPFVFLGYGIVHWLRRRRA